MIRTLTPLVTASLFSVLAAYSYGAAPHERHVVQTHEHKAKPVVLIRHDSGVSFRLSPDAKVTTFRQKQAKALTEVYNLSQADIQKPINLWSRQ